MINLKKYTLFATNKISRNISKPQFLKNHYQDNSLKLSHSTNPKNHKYPNKCKQNLKSNLKLSWMISVWARKTLLIINYKRDFGTGRINGDRNSIIKIISLLVILARRYKIDWIPSISTNYRDMKSHRLSKLENMVLLNHNKKCIMTRSLNKN